MSRDLTFIDKDLDKNDYIGVVIFNNDPTFSGRCKVRVFGLMDKIPDEYIPWAMPASSNIFSSNGAGSLSIPKLGAFVKVMFNNGNIYAPEYTCIQNIDKDLVEKLKNDYEDAHVLLYDSAEDTNIIYQKGSGISIFNKGSYVNIAQDSLISIQHADQYCVIQLDGKNINIATNNEVNVSASGTVNLSADEVNVLGNIITKIGNCENYSPALLSNVIWPLLEAMGAAIDEKMPATPATISTLVKSARGAGSSKNVMIGD